MSTGRSGAFCQLLPAHPWCHSYEQNVHTPSPPICCFTTLPFYLTFLTFFLPSLVDPPSLSKFDSERWLSASMGFSSTLVWFQSCTATLETTLLAGITTKHDYRYPGTPEFTSASHKTRPFPPKLHTFSISYYISSKLKTRKCGYIEGDYQFR